MRASNYRANPSDSGGKVLILALLGGAGWLWYEWVNRPYGGFLSPNSVPPSGNAAPSAAASGAPDPTSAAANSYGQALWSQQHSGNPSGYAQMSRTDQITWNSVALNGH